MMTPVSWFTGNLIGLTGEAAAEKQRIHASSSHARWASEEVAAWQAISEAAAVADLPADLPVAVVTAGAAQGWNPVKHRQARPAQRSGRGHVEHVAGSNHANLLGPDYAPAVVRGIEHVLSVASRS